MEWRIPLVLALTLAGSGCANHPLLDDVTGLSTHDVMRKVRCETAGPVSAYYHKYNIEALKAGQEKITDKIKKKQKIYAAEEEIVQRLLANHGGREKEFDRLTVKKSDVGNMISALEEVVRKLREQLKDETDPHKIEALRLLIDKAEKRTGAVTDEAYLTVNLLKYFQEDLDAETKTLQARIEKQQKLRESIAKLQKDATKPPYDRLIRFDQAILAMTFEFDITENNNASANGSIVWPIHTGTFTLGWTGGKERKRLSERDANTVTDFRSLIDLFEKKKECEGASQGDVSDRARSYPITGNIGMAEFMDQYFKFADSIPILSGKESFRDKLVFTTKIKGSLKPNIELAPRAPKPKISATLDLNADRQDVHSVTIAVYPKDASKDPSALPTTINIGTVPELSLHLAKDAAERYLKLGRDGNRER